MDFRTSFLENIAICTHELSKKKIVKIFTNLRKCSKIKNKLAKNSVILKNFPKLVENLG